MSLQRPLVGSSANMGNEPRFIAYAVPRARNDEKVHIWNGDGFKVFSVPLGDDSSFLDFDGMVFFGGAFDRVVNGFSRTEVVCANQGDLDLREREFYSAVLGKKPAVILLHRLLQRVDFCDVDFRTDLFRRIAVSFEIEWNCSERPSPLVESTAPEFRDYVSRFGAGYVALKYRGREMDFLKPICKVDSTIYGVTIVDKVVILPCIIPQSAEKAQQIVTAAVAATIAYRKRVSREKPNWVGEFIFDRERKLGTELDAAQQQAVKLESEIDNYADWKGALCFQSDPLVNVILRLLDHFFGIKLVVDQKYIEDATLRGDNDAILAVFEIKGVKGTFTRGNVNQVDSHRERLGVPPTTPGVLIMNTKLGAASLKEKEEQPHPDIIGKAVDENVLLVRTLDLLRFADGVEKGFFKANDLRTLFLTKAGWLRVQADNVEIVKG